MIEDTGITVAFWVLAVTTVGCALMVAFVRNLIHAVLFLALTFVGVAGLYIVLSADFVAVVQVLIYAGAVGVLMMFAVMLTPASDRGNTSTSFEFPALVARWPCPRRRCLRRVRHGLEHDRRPRFSTTARALGEAFLKPYVVPFEVASVLLMTAMIGAIVLSREDDDA